MRSLTVLWMACCACSTAPTPPPPAPTPAGGRPPIAILAEPEGKLLLTLGAGATPPAAIASAPLSALETQALLARLEPLPALDNTHAPIMRPPSARPPSAGMLTPIAFVAPAGKAVADRPIAPVPAKLAPLVPPQISPTGDVSIESEIRVRFDEPMIAIGAIGDTAQAVATIEPPIAGKWRWLDTHVAMFVPVAARLPQATELTVTVAAGARAVSGAVLAEAAIDKLATAPVDLAGTYPATVRPDEPVAIKLDQDADPDAIAKLIHAVAHKTAMPFEVVTLDRAKQAWMRRRHFTFSAAELGAHYVILAPAGSWPSAAEIAVTLDKGAPSREGPRLSQQPSTVKFDVVPRFGLRGVACGGSDPSVARAMCPALSWASVELTNAIDESSYRSELVQLAGLPFDDHRLSGADIELGELPATVGATYTVAIGDGLVDVYGQPYTGPHQMTFTSTRAQWDSSLSADTGLYVLDPRYQVPQWTVTADAVPAMHVELYAAEPADYFAYTRLEAGTTTKVPGKRMFARDYAVGARFQGQARVDLRPALGTAGTGHVIAIATADHVPRQLAWIEVTKLGVVARIDGEQASAWTSDLSPAHFLAPLPAVATALMIEGAPAAAPTLTDASGHAALELPAPPVAKPIERRLALISLSTATDSAFVPIDRDRKSIRTRSAEWYVADDRFTYKPGEPVYVKGWLRWTHDGVNPGLELPAAGDTVAYSLVDPRGVQLAAGTTALTAQGGFDFQATIPETANLGTATFTITTKNQATTHPIAIQEFRAPVYSVALEDDVAGSGVVPLVLGESIEMRAEAHYYAGGGLAGAAINWNASLKPSSYRPAGFDGFDFTPAHRDYDRGAVAIEQTTLGGSSSSAIQLGIAALPGGVPSLLEVDATVHDIDRGTSRASSRKIVVHPSSYYVGVRLAPGSLDRLEVVVADLDSHAVAGIAVDVTVDGVLESEEDRDDARAQDTQHCHVTTEATPVPCMFHVANAQLVYTATARVVDARGRANTAKYRVPWWRREARHEALALSSDRATYRAGDVAKLTIVSDVVPAHAVVSFTRQGIVSQHPIELAKLETSFNVPIDVSYLENVHVVVDRVARRRAVVDAKASSEPLPEHVQAEIDLAIDKRGAALEVQAKPRQPAVGPGQPATFEVTVARNGAPVAGAEVALMVVDEAVLALSGEHHADPLEPFYRSVDDGTVARTNLELVRDAGSDLTRSPGYDRIGLDNLFGTGSGYGTGYGDGRGGMAMMSSSLATSSTVHVRQDFRATAVWAPKLVTDVQGHASVTVTMPDSLTRFRVVALVAKDAYYFGKAEGAIVTRRPVNARIVAPRFLTQGDSFSLPIVVQNLDTTARTIDVAVRAANLVATGPAGQRVTVPAGQRAEVRFEFRTQGRGRAEIQAAVQSKERVDASMISLPVYEPATTETFATYGIVDGDRAFERLDVPDKIFADVGGIETELASTQMQALTDAYWYLQAYPYECAEQRSSRMLATTAMAGIEDAFAVPGRATHAELADQRRKDIAKLVSDQADDGGWGYWRDSRSDPFVTMQVMQALAGEPSAADAVAKARVRVGALVTTTLARLAARPDARDRGAVAYEVSLAATALQALAAIGADERAPASRLHDIATRLGQYPIDAKARLLAIVAKQPAAMAMRAALVQDLVNATHETAAGATVATGYEEAERLLLPSNNRTTALALDALIREVPEHALIPKLARGLLGARRGGRWRSTQENLAVMQAMRRYFDQYEHATPNFTGKLWIGDAAYAEHAFTGHTLERAVAGLDWAALGPGSQHDIAIAKAGTGRLYYRIGITYAPARATVAALDAGFVVRRAYQAIDDPHDVTKTADGWKIKLGARVQIVLETVNTTQRDDVAFVDPLPAGFEPVNTALANSERAATDTSAAGRLPTEDWDHVELRDNRAEAFALELAAGTHRFTYTVRATTPGSFIAAPTKAEEMYTPETFGRSSSETVVIY